MKPSTAIWHVLRVPFLTASRQARERRRRLFLEHFAIGPETRILDLGSEDGSNIDRILAGTAVRRHNVYIADIDPRAVQRGHERFGFVPVAIPESGRLPFDDQAFDIVFCSSVLEHVTVPKRDVWAMRSGREFLAAGAAHQREFADEIRRLGRSYFVQTPYRWFPIESHTWLPFAGYLPRPALVPLLKAVKPVWIKRTKPDFLLHTRQSLQTLFPEAVIHSESVLGLTKSLVAMKPLPGRVPLASAAEEAGAEVQPARLAAQALRELGPFPGEEAPQ